ncbi:MAG: PHP domain-containing protein [Clostridia bacterium]|nr:PHP domain-containing protein [Clostridia bacterium]
MNKKMIDLHSHTINSDGTWTTKEILTNAEKLGLEVFSITDHDTAKAYIEIEKDKELQNIYKGKLIKGVELNCTFDGIKIEILAYNFDLNPVQEWLENYYTVEKNNNRLVEEFNDLVKICHKKGIKIEKDLMYNPNTEYPVDVIYYSITKFEENKVYFTEEQWKDRALFFRTCTVDKSFPLYRDFSKQMPTLEFFSKFIHQYNGKIFLAHLYKYQLNDHISYLNKIIDKKLLDGVEVYHSSFTEKQMLTLEKYCMDRNLLMCGGSDCHGEKKKDRKLGIGYGNLNINKSIINNWNI